MKTSIYSVRTTPDTLSFYLEEKGKEYFLFDQGFYVSDYRYFGKKVFLSDALDFSKSQRNHAIARTMNKLPAYIRYVEKENGIEVLTKTKKKHNKMNAAGVKLAA